MTRDNVLARVVAIREALITGDCDYAETLAGDLEDALLERARKPHRCGTCGNRYRWPGELEAHALEAHGWKGQP